MFQEVNNGGLVTLAASNLTCPHGFTTRLGGVSRGIFESLNLTKNRGDDPEAVRENYRRLKAAFGIGKLCFTRQVHENTVRTVTAADALEPFDEAPPCDGLVTGEYDLGLLIFTADCIPILLQDPARHIIGAAHAGWRGTVADIAGKAVEAMVRLGSDPRDIRAAIGPGISRCCFETGPEVPEAVLAVLGDAGRPFIDPSPRQEGKFFVDLKGVNRALLVRAGVPPEAVEVSDRCTVCEHDLFWSHRWTRGRRGGQGAVIVQRRA